MIRLLTLLLLTNLYLNAALPAKIQADRYLLQAKHSIENGEYAQAKGYFEKILALNIKVPNNFNYFYGKTLVETGNYTKALQYLEKFLSNGGDKTKHYTKALDLYTKAEEEIEAQRIKAEKEAKVRRIKEAKTITIAGLMWQDREYTQKERKRYSDSLSYGKARDWQGAKRYCQNLGLGGYSDWYLPSKRQLKSLYDNKSQLLNNISDSFWSSSEYDNSNALIWSVNFNDGSTDYYSPSNVLYVRCVRSRQ